MNIWSGLLVSGRTSHPCLSKLLSDFSQRLGSTALNAKRYDEAVLHYTTALSLNPPSPQGILIKRSKAYMASRTWKEALDDANQVDHLSLLQVNRRLQLRGGCIRDDDLENSRVS